MALTRLDTFPIPLQPHTQQQGIPSCPFSVDLYPVIRSLPIGFRALVLSNHLTLDIALVISQIVATLSIDKQVAITMCCTAQHGTYSDHLEACISLSHPESSLERFVCLGLMLFRAILFREVRMGRFLLHMPRLQLSLHLKDIQDQPMSVRRCLVWLYMIAIDGWKDKAGSGLLPPGRLLFKELHTRFEAEAKTWSQTEAILADFFWPKQLKDWWSVRYDVFAQMV